MVPGTHQGGMSDREQWKSDWREWDGGKLIIGLPRSAVLGKSFNTDETVDEKKLCPCSLSMERSCLTSIQVGFQSRKWKKYEADSRRYASEESGPELT